MIVKRFKSAITYLNVPSIFLPTFSEKANEGVGWVKRKNRDPFLAGTRLKFPNVVILSINHDSKN